MAVYDKNGRMIKSSDDRIGKDIGMTSNGQEIKIGESHDGKYRIYKNTHRGAYYLTERNNVKDMISFNSPSVETRLERWASIYDIELNREYLNSSRKPVKSSFVINYYDEAGYQSNNFIDANAKGLVSSPIGAMTFETREDAQEWIDTQAEKNVFDPEYCEIQSVDEIQSSRKPVKSAVDEAGYEYDYGKVDELCQKASDEMGGDRDALFFSSSTFRDYDGFMLKGHYLEQIVDEFGDDPETIWTALCTELGMGDFSAQAIGEDWLNYTLFVKWAGSPQGIESSLSRNENSMNVVFGK